MFDLLGHFVARHWLSVIVGWIVLAAGLHFVAPRWDDVTNDGDLAYLPAHMTSVRGEKLLARAFPENRSKSQIVCICERTDGPLIGADYAVLDQLAAAFDPETATDLPIDHVWTRKEKLVGKKLVSPESPKGQAGLVIVYLTNEFMALDNVRVLGAAQKKLDEIRSAETFPDGLRLGLSGSAAIGGDMLGAAQESIGNIEISAVVLVLVILLLVYRAPLLVLVPVAIMVLSTIVAMDLVAWATTWPWLDFKVFTTTRIFVIVVLFGSGTDYCLFLIARYKEELQRGADRATATHLSLSQVGLALTGSALTTICGLGMMWFSQFGKFRYSGPIIGACLCVTLAASVTLAPALLRAMGRAVFWPFKFADAPTASGLLARPLPAHASLLDRLWDWTAQQVMFRPSTILIAFTALMAPLAYVGWDVPLTYDFLHELNADRDSVQGTAMLERHFPAGEIGPLTIVAHHPDGKFDTPEGELKISQLTRALWKHEGVTTVRSLTEPLGDAPYVNPLNFTKAAARKHPKAREIYVSHAEQFKGQVTRLEVLFSDDPFSNASTDVLNEIDRELRGVSADASSPWYGTQFDLVGTTAGKRDLATVTAADRITIQVLVTSVVFVLLWYVSGRPVVAIFLILSVLLSYYVTMGISELFFGWAYGATFVGLDWKVPIFLFVILVAIGEDYNIYLVTRVLEEQRSHGQRQGLRKAVVATGGIITSCGVIMAGSFVSMATGTLRGIVQLGFALSVGILLDTFVIRTILVPAFMALVDRLSHRGEEDEPHLEISVERNEALVSGATS